MPDAKSPSGVRSLLLTRSQGVPERPKQLYGGVLVCGFCFDIRGSLERRLASLILPELRGGSLRATGAAFYSFRSGSGGTLPLIEFNRQCRMYGHFSINGLLLFFSERFPLGKTVLASVSWPSRPRASKRGPFSGPEIGLQKGEARLSAFPFLKLIFGPESGPHFLGPPVGTFSEVRLPVSQSPCCAEPPFRWGLMQPNELCMTVRLG